MAAHQDIILAAIPIATRRQETNPDVPFTELVRQASVEIAVLLTEGSEPDTAISQIEDAVTKNAFGKSQGVFVGTIVAVKRDPRNQRAVVVFRPTHEGESTREDGTETISTEPTYKDEGIAVANLAKSLKGHRVRMYKNHEHFQGKDGAGRVVTKKGKVLRHLVDLGVVEED